MHHSWGTILSVPDSHRTGGEHRDYVKGADIAVTQLREVPLHSTYRSIHVHHLVYLFGVRSHLWGVTPIMEVSKFPRAPPCVSVRRSAPPVGCHPHNPGIKVSMCTTLCICSAFDPTCGVSPPHWWYRGFHVHHLVGLFGVRPHLWGVTPTMEVSKYPRAPSCVSVRRSASPVRCHPHNGGFEDST